MKDSLNTTQQADFNQDAIVDQSAEATTTLPREGFVFYFRFYDAIKLLPARQQLKAIDILIGYARSRTIPEKMSSRIEQFFIMAQPQIDANERKRINGFKGKKDGVKGTEYGRKGGRPKQKQADSTQDDDDDFLE